MATSKGEEHVVTTTVPSSPIEISHTGEHCKYTDESHRRVMRKIDFWLVGFYSVVYVFRVIDSGNYSNAAIINLEEGSGIKK